MLDDLRVRSSRYGWIPDLPDQRDWLYATMMPSAAATQASVDWRSRCSSIEDQGQLGSCTANALVGNLEYLEPQDFSRLFVYYNERLMRGSTETDSGSSLRDGIKTLVKVGDCLESEWPYVIEQYRVRPSKECYRAAAHYQIQKYYRITSPAERKHTLQTGYPFVFGFAVYDSFETEQVARTGMVPLPTQSEHLLGGHAVMAVGYDEAKEVYIVRNSWGVSWGDRGYCYMPFAYLDDANLASDFWTIRTMENGA